MYHARISWGYFIPLLACLSQSQVVSPEPSCVIVPAVRTDQESEIVCGHGFILVIQHSALTPSGQRAVGLLADSLWLGNRELRSCLSPEPPASETEQKTPGQSGSGCSDLLDHHAWFQPEFTLCLFYHHYILPLFPWKRNFLLEIPISQSRKQLEKANWKKGKAGGKVIFIFLPWGRKEGKQQLSRGVFPQTAELNLCMLT